MRQLITVWLAAVLRTPSCGLTCLLLLASATTVPAHAQLGGLIKKKVNQTVTKATAAPPKFDDVVVELTPERLAGWIKGAQASQRFNQTPNGPPHFMALRQPVAKKLDETNLKYSEELNDYTNRVAAVSECVRSGSSAIQRAKRSAMVDQRPPSAAWMKILMEFSQAMAAAQQRGDAAEVARLQKRHQDQFDPTPAELAEVEAKCGAPAQSANVKEALSLQAQVAQFDESIRKATEALQKLQEAESGMTARQFAIAFERICDNIKAVVDNSTPARLTAVELAAFKANQAELAKLCPRPA